MRCIELTVGNRMVQLRLTTAKLQQYLKNNDGDKQNPLICVVDALSNLDKRISLFTQALQWPGNTNEIKNGADLLDILHDDGMQPQEVNRLIFQLACQAGLIDAEDLEDMIAAADLGDVRFTRVMCSLLAAEEPEQQKAPQGNEGKAEAENPTQDLMTP